MACPKPMAYEIHGIIHAEHSLVLAMSPSASVGRKDPGLVAGI